MQKVLKQNLRKVVLYVNKPRPAARGRSQNTGNEGCKKQRYSLRQHQQQCTKHVSTKSLSINQIFDIIIYVLKRYNGIEKLSTLISGCCSCIRISL